MRNIKRYTYFLTVGKKGYYLSLPNCYFSSKRKAIQEVERLFCTDKLQDYSSFERGKLIMKCIVRIEKLLLN